MMPSVPTTTRAICIGLFLAVALNLTQLYNDYFLWNTILVLNHLPTVGTAILLFLIVTGAVMRKLGRGKVFSQGELLLIWSMVCVAGGIGATGFGRAVPGFAASPAYLATTANEYVPYLVKNLPDWMVVSKDLDSEALRWYFEGLPREQSIPWGAWIVPMAAWTGFAVCLFAVMFAFSSIFYQQWAQRERLTFPIVYLPLAITGEAPRGRMFNDFLRNPVVWMGAALPLLVYGVNGLHDYFPEIPQIPTQWSTWGLFPDRPWSQFNMGWATLYFSIVGLTFLLTTEVSFSIWFFFVAYRLSFVYVAWLGAAGTGFWGDWYTNVIVFEAAGAAFALGLFLFWAARQSLLAWLGRAWRGVSDITADLIPARLTLYLLVAGLAGIVGWVMLAGANWWAAMLGMALFLCVILVLTRLVVEAGLLLVGTEAIAYEFLTGLVPSSWLNGPAVATFVQLRGALMSDLRNVLMPYLMNSVRACSQAMLNARKVLGILALTVIVALGSCIYGRVTTAYKYGAAHGDLAYNGGWQNNLYPKAVKYQKTPPNYEWIRIAQLRVLPVTVAHVCVGAGLTAAMLILRAAFLWWPLNPLGFIVCGSWAISMIWFSVLLGWLAKALVMRFGGAMAYRRLLPFFLGLVLGQAIIATFWMITSLITGHPSVHMNMLPH